MLFSSCNSWGVQQPCSLTPSMPWPYTAQKYYSSPWHEIITSKPTGASSQRGYFPKHSEMLRSLKMDRGSYGFWTNRKKGKVFGSVCLIVRVHASREMSSASRIFVAEMKKKKRQFMGRHCRWRGKVLLLIDEKIWEKIQQMFSFAQYFYIKIRHFMRKLFRRDFVCLSFWKTSIREWCGNIVISGSKLNESTKN